MCQSHRRVRYSLAQTKWDTCTGVPFNLIHTVNITEFITSMRLPSDDFTRIMKLFAQKFGCK